LRGSYGYLDPRRASGALAVWTVVGMPVVGQGRSNLPSIFEKILKVRPTVNYGSRSLLQLALDPHEEWSPHLHRHALFQGNFVYNVTKLRMILQNLIDFVPQVCILVSQLLVRHCRFHLPLRTRQPAKSAAR
jgi:hypothetical protein